MGNIFSIFFSKPAPALEQGEVAVESNNQQIIAEDVKQDEVAVEAKDQQIVTENEKLEPTTVDVKDQAEVEEIQVSHGELIEAVKQDPTPCLIAESSNEPPSQEEKITQHTEIVEVVEEKDPPCSFAEHTNEPPSQQEKDDILVPEQNIVEKFEVSHVELIEAVKQEPTPCGIAETTNEPPTQEEKVAAPAETEEKLVAVEDVGHIEEIETETIKDPLPEEQKTTKDKENDTNEAVETSIKGAEELKEFMSNELLENTESVINNTLDDNVDIPSQKSDFCVEEPIPQLEATGSLISSSTEAAKDKETAESVKGAEELKNIMAEAITDSANIGVNPVVDAKTPTPDPINEEIKEEKKVESHEANVEDVESNGIAEAVANAVVDTAFIAASPEENEKSDEIEDALTKVVGVEPIGAIIDTGANNAIEQKEVSGASDLKALLEGEK